MVEKETGHKEEQRLHDYACYVTAAVGEKACLRMK